MEFQAPRPQKVAKIPTRPRTKKPGSQTENPAQSVRGYPAWDEKGVVRKSPKEYRALVSG